MSKSGFVCRRVVVVCAITVALLVAVALVGARAAYAGSSCTVGTTYYAGHEEYSIPATGGSASAQITDNADQLFTASGAAQPSHLAAYVGVQDTSGSHWLKAGIYDDAAHGRILWIDYNTDATGHHFVQEQYANIGTTYLAKVTKVATGDWDAQIGAFHVTGVPLNGMTETRYVGASFTESTTCNMMAFTFNNSSPWSPAQMNATLQGGPYQVADTSVGWVSAGGDTKITTYCLVGPMTGEGPYTGTIPVTPAPGQRYGEFKTTITDANILGFVGNAQISAFPSGNPYVQMDLNLLPSQSKTTLGPSFLVNAYQSSVYFHIFLTAESDAVGLAYQICAET